MLTKELLRYRFNQFLDLANRPGLVRLKYAGKYLQAMLHPQEFAQMRQLAARPEMAALLAEQPYFAYKYLRTYAAAALPRPARVATILHHYRQLAALAPGLVARVAARPAIWQEQVGGQAFSIRLAYPVQSTYEGELSLHFYQGEVQLQTITCVLTPGSTLALPAPQVLLICHVQGIPDVETLRQAGRLLSDCGTPGTLLVNAAYGLAAALDVRYAAGIGTQGQLSRGIGSYFNYDGFWEEQFNAPPLPSSGFYLLNPAAPERPIEEIKSKHRTRTLRRRAFRQQVRRAVEATLRADYRLAGQEAAVPGLALVVQ